MSSSWFSIIKSHLKGFFFFGFLAGVNREKKRLDELVMFCIFGKTIGIPGLFNYYHLRLLPYYIGHLYTWKRRVLRERDFFDRISD